MAKDCLGELQTTLRASQDHSGPLETAQDRSGPLRAIWNNLGLVNTSQDCSELFWTA